MCVSGCVGVRGWESVAAGGVCVGVQCKSFFLTSEKVHAKDCQ